MCCHEASVLIVEFPIACSEGLNNLVAWYIFELINLGLGCLSILNDSESGLFYYVEPVKGHQLSRVLIWCIGKLGHRHIHFFGEGTSASCYCLFAFSCMYKLCSHVFFIRDVCWDREIAKFKELVNALSIPLRCSWSRDTIKHEILNETGYDAFISVFSTTGVRIEFWFTPVYVLSLPKPFCFNSITLFKSGDFCINKISQIMKRSSRLGWKKQQFFNSAWSCWSLEKS